MSRITTVSSIHQNQCAAIRRRSCSIIFLQLAEVSVQGTNLPSLYRHLVKLGLEVLVGAKVPRKRRKLHRAKRGMDFFGAGGVTPTDRLSLGCRCLRMNPTAADNGRLINPPSRVVRSVLREQIPQHLETSIEIALSPQQARID